VCELEVAPGAGSRRRNVAADFDEDEGANGGGEDDAPVAASRPPMKGWGDSPMVSPPQPMGQAEAVEGGAVSSNLDDGAPAAEAKQGFGRRQTAARGAPKSVRNRVVGNWC
jgi:hypothetical protein